MEPDAVLQRQRIHFRTGATAPLEARQAALLRLRTALEGAEADLNAALMADLGKPAFDVYTGEILHVRQEIAHAVANLRRWAKPKRVATTWFHWPARASYEHRPKGVVLVLSPWNYPVQLSLLPLVSAVAAGNCAVLKPSELAPATAQVLQRIVQECFDPAHVQVLTGDAALAQRLTALPFDHIFFTGSTAVGRAVAMAAAANLTECTLELGGCNPCVVDETANPVTTARRIAWGKFLNAGQTCIAPNHVLVHESQHDALVAALQTALTQFYGADGRGMSRVVNRRHFERLVALLDGGRVVHGGQADGDALHIQPTILDQVPSGSPLLHNEIFGPVLPITVWRDRQALLDQLAAMPSPLAIYLHTADQALVSSVMQHTRSGSVVVNDHIVQATVPDLPFGGVGPSGHGRYHGRFGFETFSYTRTLLQQSARIDLPLRYPPHGDRLKMVKRFMR